jgi:ABC-type uncharacterized transport system fused permease/ATPase subunit
VKLLAWVVLLSAVALSVGAYGTYLNRDITNALVGKHLALFYRVMMFAAAAAIIGVLAKVLREYVGSLLYIEWREWLTRYFIDEGFSHRTFYRNILQLSADHRWKVEPSSEFEPLTSAASSRVVQANS